MPKYKSSKCDWLVNEKYKDQIKKANDKHEAYCTVCLKEFSVAWQVTKALDIHAEEENDIKRNASNEKIKVN